MKLWGCRQSGIGVGELSIWGAICLKACTCNQDKASAKMLLTPAICLTFKTMYGKHTKTSFPTKNINSLSLQYCLLITWTKALLSVINSTCLLDIWRCIVLIVNTKCKQYVVLFFGQPNCRILWLLASVKKQTWTILPQYLSTSLVLIVVFLAKLCYA